MIKTRVFCCCKFKLKGKKRRQSSVLFFVFLIWIICRTIYHFVPDAIYFIFDLIHHLKVTQNLLLILITGNDSFFNTCNCVGFVYVW